MKNSITTVLTFLTALVVCTAFIPTSDLQKSIGRGKEVYTIYCMSCHMADGTGTPGVNPPLAKADYMKKPAKTLINIILQGQSGEITVNNVKYNGLMPAQAYLTDEQIADVLNYSRNSWGNKNPAAITPAQVKALRK